MKTPNEIKHLLLLKSVTGGYTLHDVWGIERFDFVKKGSVWLVKPCRGKEFKESFSYITDIKFKSLFKALQYVSDCGKGVLSSLINK